MTLAADQAALRIVACMQLNSRGCRRRGNYRLWQQNHSVSSFRDADVTDVWQKDVNVSRIRGCRIIHTHIQATCESGKQCHESICRVWHLLWPKYQIVHFSRQSQEVKPTAVVSSTGYKMLTELLLKWTMSVMPCCGVPETKGPLLQCCAQDE